MKANWIIRVILDHAESVKVGYFLNILEVAGYITIHRYDSDGICFDFLQLFNLSEEEARSWRNQIINNCALFCWNAVEAPPMPYIQDMKNSSERR